MKLFTVVACIGIPEDYSYEEVDRVDIGHAVHLAERGEVKIYDGNVLVSAEELRRMQRDAREAAYVTFERAKEWVVANGDETDPELIELIAEDVWDAFSVNYVEEKGVGYEFLPGKDEQMNWRFVSEHINGFTYIESDELPF